MSDKIVVAKMVEGKFGAQVLDVAGNYYSFSKKYKGPTVFESGTVLEADVFVSQKGKYTNRYLNSATLVGVEAPKVGEAHKAVEAPKETKKAFKAKDDTSMSKAEWQAKDRSQLIGGLSHDAAAITVGLLTVHSFSKEDQTVVETALEVYEEVLNRLLSIRDRVK